jgi:hypothetical protein
MRHISLMQPHRFEMKHIINFSNTAILDKALGYTVLLIKKAIEMRLHPTNFKQNRGFNLNWFWYLATNMTEKY